MEEVKVSIVVAVYNVREYLEKCVMSICHQTWKNLEIILVDDGSKDGSGKICDELAEQDARILVIHQKNSGVSEARNAGIKRASGTYTAFIDSDDYLEAEYVERLVEQADANNLTVAGYYIDIEMPGRMRKRTVIAGKAPITYLDAKQAVTVYQMGLFSAVWNKLYETTVLRNGIFFDCGYSLGEDLLFNLKYLSEKERGYCIINQPLYHYMKRGTESLYTKYRSDFFDTQVVLFEKFIKYLIRIKADRNDIEILYQHYFQSLIVALDNLYCNRKRMEKEQYRMRFQKIAQSQKMNAILEQLHGRRKRACSLRLWGIRHGLYYIDYGSRECVKRIMGMK